jgi:hypothetical protein
MLAQSVPEAVRATCQEKGHEEGGRNSVGDALAKGELSVLLSVCESAACRGKGRRVRMEGEGSAWLTGLSNVVASLEIPLGNGGEADVSVWRAVAGLLAEDMSLRVGDDVVRSEERGREKVQRRRFVFLPSEIRTCCSRLLLAHSQPDLI